MDYDDIPAGSLDLTVLLAARNESANMARCLNALFPAKEVLLVDSQSTDGTTQIAAQWGARVVQFQYAGGYPKKRQWALENVPISTGWVLLLDCDEQVPKELWREIGRAIADGRHQGYLIQKEFHFLGRKLRYGGFSHRAVMLLQRGKGRFESLVTTLADGLDMEVHERVIVDGTIGSLDTPVIHQDFKGLHAYLDRHNRYSTWEAKLRSQLLRDGTYGTDTVQAKWWGNAQERRRFLKKVVCRMPFEPWIWFIYHYFLRLGFLDGRRGLIAAQIRSDYIRQVRAKVYEATL
jgi:glycosyltransferase involved in cell wall biosynthesis